MKKIFLITCILLTGVALDGQVLLNGHLIQLGQFYKDYMFQAEPDAKFLKKFNKNFPVELQTEAEFIKQTISSRNSLLKSQYLLVPSEPALKNIYLIERISSNMREETSIGNNELIDSLHKATIPRYELVNNYYNMLFTGVGNKNKPFDLSKSNLVISEYGLKDEVEKGIFFLNCMDLCGSHIWGYINIVQPPNTKEAMSHIMKFPKINGKPYYQFTDLFFKDFKMVIDEDEGPQSYKTHYLNQYYETLLSHLICLNEEGGSEEEKKDLLLSSILRAEKLYKYSKYKDVLDKLFEKRERD